MTATTTRTIVRLGGEGATRSSAPNTGSLSKVLTLAFVALTLDILKLTELHGMPLTRTLPVRPSTSSPPRTYSLIPQLKMKVVALPIFEPGQRVSQEVERVEHRSKSPFIPKTI